MKLHMSYYDNLDTKDTWKMFMILGNNISLVLFHLSNMEKILN